MGVVLGSLGAIFNWGNVYPKYLAILAAASGVLLLIMSVIVTIYEAMVRQLSDSVVENMDFQKGLVAEFITPKKPVQSGGQSDTSKTSNLGKKTSNLRKVFRKLDEEFFFFFQITIVNAIPGPIILASIWYVLFGFGPISLSILAPCFIATYCGCIFLFDCLWCWVSKEYPSPNGDAATCRFKQNESLYELTKKHLLVPLREKICPSNHDSPVG
jgi:hypothetical protein